VFGNIRFDDVEPLDSAKNRLGWMVAESVSFGIKRGNVPHNQSAEEWSPNVTQLLRLFKICRDPRLLTWC